MNLFNEQNNNAIFSEDGKHRIMLCRRWHIEGPFIMFIGLNPSTANATMDDNTIRRVKTMAKSWGYGGVFMMNLFTFISTDPKRLNTKNGNVEKANEYIIDIADRCQAIVFAWGNFNTFGRDAEIIKMFPYAKALKINKNGSPKHPLYVKSNTQLIPFL